jgi:hypothetical protein
VLNNFAAYVEAVREKRRQRSKRYYDEVIKNDPEKCQKWKDKSTPQSFYNKSKI